MMFEILFKIDSALCVLYSLKVNINPTILNQSNVNQMVTKKASFKMVQDMLQCFEGGYEMLT